MKNYGATASSSSTNVFNKNKKKKINEELNLKTSAKRWRTSWVHVCSMDHPLFKKPKVYHWCSCHFIWTIHKEDKFEKCLKMSKLDKVHKEKKGGKNINKAYNFFPCELEGENPNVFFLEGNDFRGEQVTVMHE